MSLTPPLCKKRTPCLVNTRSVSVRDAVAFEGELFLRFHKLHLAAVNEHGYPTVCQVWDGVSNRCVNTNVGAHDGDEVCSAVFSRNGKYLLTSGKDSVARLWDLASPGQPVIVYTGAELSGKQVRRVGCLVVVCVQRFRIEMGKVKQICLRFA